MATDFQNFTQRGPNGYWYRLADTRSKKPYVPTTCETCGIPCLVKRAGGRVCSLSCINTKETISYQGWHKRILRERGSTSTYQCIFVGYGCTETSTVMDWSHNTDGLGPDLQAWFPACRSCHRRFEAAIREVLKDEVDPRGWRPWQRAAPTRAA